MNFVFSFHLEETPTQSSTWCLEMVGLPIVGLLLAEGPCLPKSFAQVKYSLSQWLTASLRCDTE